MSAEGRGAGPDGRSGSAPRIALMVITDGRWHYLRDTVASAEANLDWQFSYKLLVDDSGSNTELAPQFAGFHYLKNAERRGLAGAIQAGWDNLPDCEYVFHLEDDFTFPQHVDVASMVKALEADDTLAQVALMRQPWGPDEIAAGSVYRAHPAGTFSMTKRDGVELVTHRNLFTFNPCLYPRHITDYGAGLEQDVTDSLRAKGYRFAYLGNVTDPPRCWHIGAVRSAGYRW